MTARALRTGSADDLAAVMGLPDRAVEWLVGQGRTGQWGDQPWSALHDAATRATSDSRQNVGSGATTVGFMTTTTASSVPVLTVHAIDPAELAEIRRSGRDTAGNVPTPWPDATGAPLRCCLRRARPDDDVLLISYAPLRQRSPWREVGPVFVHARPCDGWEEDSGLPPELRRGPRVLRGYREDGSLDYSAIRVVPEGEDVEPPLQQLLADPAVHEVHVRALAEQCFTFRVRAARR